MKKLFLSLIIVVIAFTTSFGQNKLPMHYDEQFLNQKTKVELTDIYMEKFQVLLKTLPYTSFTLRMDSIVVDTLNQKVKLDIPNNKYTKNKREKVSKEAEEYNKVIKEQLLEIVPYSDKNEIIRGIMFLQKMTEKLNNNF